MTSAIKQCVLVSTCKDMHVDQMGKSSGLNFTLSMLLPELP